MSGPSIAMAHHVQDLRLPPRPPRQNSPNPAGPAGRSLHHQAIQVDLLLHLEAKLRGLAAGPTSNLLLEEAAVSLRPVVRESGSEPPRPSGVRPVSETPDLLEHVVHQTKWAAHQVT